MIKARTIGLMALLALGGWSYASLKGAAQEGSFSTARDPNQVPTARYGRGEEVDLALIIGEWRDRFPAIPIFVCTCNADTCGDKDMWPFREFSRYQTHVALGDFNGKLEESYGFNCFDMETGERPEG